MIKLYSEGPGLTISPRISFSHDLSHGDGIPVECRRADRSVVDSSRDFSFRLDGKIRLESFPADEIFSDGKILPIIPHSFSKENSPSKPLDQTPPSPSPPPPPPHPTPPASRSSALAPRRESLRHMLAIPDIDAEEKQPASKSFWRMKRCSSLSRHAGNKCRLMSKLPLLNRSQSTGSANQNKSEHCKDEHKQRSTQFPSASVPAPSWSLPKPVPPLKNSGRSRPAAHGRGIRISPVLNVPSPYISPGTTHLFGFGYLFGTGRDRGRAKNTSPAQNDRIC